ncbi:hypothetical protein EDB19DRAFT_2028678 [Suillus lakei]|nr:hypothetical protein EDB19DRAFT_2028678 [Suillus lakei]
MRGNWQTEDSFASKLGNEQATTTTEKFILLSHLSQKCVVPLRLCLVALVTLLSPLLAQTQGRKVFVRRFVDGWRLNISPSRFPSYTNPPRLYVDSQPLPPSPKTCSRVLYSHLHAVASTYPFAQSYATIHRVGRTACAGKGGEAWRKWVEGNIRGDVGDHPDGEKVNITLEGASIKSVLTKGFGGKALSTRHVLQKCNFLLSALKTITDGKYTKFSASNYRGSRPAKSTKQYDIIDAEQRMQILPVLAVPSVEEKIWSMRRVFCWYKAVTAPTSCAANAGWARGVRLEWAVAIDLKLVRAVLGLAEGTGAKGGTGREVDGGHPEIGWIGRALGMRLA